MASGMRNFRHSDLNQSEDVVISYIDCFVWMRWPGAEPMVKLGRYECVVPAMRDFIAQCDLGERLAKRSYDDRRPNRLT